MRLFLTVVLVCSCCLLLTPQVSSMSTTTTNKLLLDGKRVLVTGGGRGIGRAIALTCYEEGAKVAIASRTIDQLEETIHQAKTNLNSCSSNNESSSSSSNAEIKAHICDVTNPVEVESMIQHIVKDWGGLDILVNNAGGAQQPKGPIGSSSVTSEDLTQLLQLNVVSVHTVTSAALKWAMTTNNDTTNADCRHIVNISSKAGKVGLPNYSFYVASKFAVEGMTSSWAKELKEQNIVVTSISPGMVNTQSFPKPVNKPGVRSAESIRDTILMAMTAPMEYTGHYIHADELDMVRKRGLDDHVAWKAVDERPFDEVLHKAT